MFMGNNAAREGTGAAGVRIGLVRAYLENLRTGKPASPILPLWSLRALHDE